MQSTRERQYTFFNDTDRFTKWSYFSLGETHIIIISGTLLMVLSAILSVDVNLTVFLIFDISKIAVKCMICDFSEN